MSSDTTPYDPSTSQLRRIMFGMIVLTSAAIIFYSLLRANYWWMQSQVGFVPVSINAERSADYGAGAPGLFGQVSLAVILDVMQDTESDNVPSGKDLIDPMETPSPVSTPQTSQTPDGITTPFEPATNALTTLTGPTLPIPTLGIPTLPIPTLALPTFGPPTVGLPVSIPTALPTVGLPAIIPTGIIPDIPATQILPGLLP